jgi:hypothetical protein
MYQFELCSEVVYSSDQKTMNGATKLTPGLKPLVL